jgi:hypothetical protein
MRLYVIRFANVVTLTRAFERLMDSERVASCMIEPQERRLRFLAPVDHADAMLHHFYSEGGLVWCSRHEEISPGEVDRRPRRLDTPAPA